LADLVPGDLNGSIGIFVFDVESATRSLVSVDSMGIRPFRAE
jgi:hypothetical protein